jgi:hypothetical protein
VHYVSDLRESVHIFESLAATPRSGAGYVNGHIAALSRELDAPSMCAGQHAVDSDSVNGLARPPMKLSSQWPLSLRRSCLRSSTDGFVASARSDANVRLKNHLPVAKSSQTR